MTRSHIPNRYWNVAGVMALLLAGAGFAAEPETTMSPVASPDALVDTAAEAPPPVQAVGSVGNQVREPLPPSNGKAASRLIEEIIVTAQKREENIQDVPISITAFSADKLEALGIQSAQDLGHITPGLTITSAGGYSIAYLRGVGTDAFLPGADPSVPFYLDGVPLLGAQGSSDTLGRVQRVEVLKGPQGTLFGRNATAGAISIVTPDPNQELSGDVNLEFGNFRAMKVLAYVNLPITDGLAATMSGFDQRQDNFVVNDDNSTIAVYSRGGRVKLRWNALEDLAVTLSASSAKSSNSGGLDWELTREAPILCPAGACALPQDPKADRHVNFNTPSPGSVTRSNLYSATVDWQLPVVGLKLTGSNQRLDAHVVADFDEGPLPLLNLASGKNVAKQNTAELQILSNKDTPFADRFEWVAGLFYLHSSFGFDPLKLILGRGAVDTFAALGPQAGNLGGLFGDTLNTLLVDAGTQPLDDGATLYTYGLLVNTSISGYFQGTGHITDTLDLTLGARYQVEHRRLEHSRTSVPLASGGEVVLLSNLDLPELDAQQLSPRIALQWRPLGEGTQFYSSWARAYKSPTYNTVNLLGGLPNTVGGVTDGNGVEPPDIKPVKAERVDSFELGMKSEWLDRSLRLNAAAFYTRQKDLLVGFVAVTSGGIVNYSNAPAARIYGAEADALWTPLSELDPGLVLTTAVTGLDARYSDYPNGRGFDVATGLAFGSGGTEALPARDFSGNRIVRTPRLSWNLGISQTVAVTDGSLEFSADTNFVSGYYLMPQQDPVYSSQPHSLVNARIVYLYAPWSLQLSAFCNNLTDKAYTESALIDDIGFGRLLNAPRTFGFRGKWSF